MAIFETESFSSVDGSRLSLDIHRPSSNQGAESNIALIHFHGGFLMVGEKQTFPPAWLINACSRRGWTYVTPSYRLLPEATGQNALDDALGALTWVAKNVSSRLVVAGSSAGGFLALAATARFLDTPPLAVLSIYGMIDISSDEYVCKGTTLMGGLQLKDLDEVVRDLESAKRGAEAIDGYEFPEDDNDRRMRWIQAAHEAALFPDLVCATTGLVDQISLQGVSNIPLEYRQFFPLHFGCAKGFPPTAFLHGERDSCVRVSQSKEAWKKLRDFGTEVYLEIVPGKDHGFDTEIPADVNIEDGHVGSDLTTHLKSILEFLDRVTTKGGL